ncbi:MAG: hypothetical protein F4X39_09040 [Acidobacteriia bacterium]|nr:hypothetical protein [Terriglobia bacterium]
MRVYTDLFRDLLAEVDLPSPDPVSVRRVATEHASEGISYEIRTAFPAFAYAWKERTEVETIGPLRIHIPGSLVISGTPRAYGHIQFVYENTDLFYAPPVLPEHAREALAEGDDAVRYLRIMNRIFHNVDLAVHHVVEKMVEAVGPRHVVLCTDDEVHPLTAHGVFHACAGDFVKDLIWIGRLHEEGGLYLVESSSVTNGEAPRKVTSDYGYLRRDGQDRDTFLKELRPVVDRIRRSGDAIAGAVVDVNVALSEASRSEIKRLREGLYVCNDHETAGYLQDAYFRIFEAVFGLEFQSCGGFGWPP